MKTETPRPFLLKDYRPPNFLIDTVDLDVSLHPTRTRVRSRLKLRPNPSIAKPGALRLDGEHLELRVRAPRQPAPRGQGVQGKRPGARPSRPSQACVRARDRHLVQPRRQQGSHRPLPVEGHLLHAVRGAGLPPHHLFPRPPRCARNLHGADRGRPRRGPGAPRQRQPGGARQARRRQAPLCGLARSAPEALLPVRPGRRQPRLHRLAVHHALGPEGRAAHLRRARQGGRCAWAMDALKRSMRWDEERFGASTISTSSTSSRSPTSTWGPWRTRGSTSSTMPWCWPRPRRPPTAPSPASSA